MRCGHDDFEYVVTIEHTDGDASFTGKFCDRCTGDMLDAIERKPQRPGPTLSSAAYVAGFVLGRSGHTTKESN